MQLGQVGGWSGSPLPPGAGKAADQITLSTCRSRKRRCSPRGTGCVQCLNSSPSPESVRMARLFTEGPRNEVRKCNVCECTSCSHHGPAAARQPHPSSRSSAIWSSQHQNAAGGERVAEKYGVCGAGVNLPSLGNQIPDAVLPGGELVSTDPQTGTPAPGPCPPGASRQGQVTWTTVRPDPGVSVQAPGAYRHVRPAASLPGSAPSP